MNLQQAYAHRIEEMEREYRALVRNAHHADGSANVERLIDLATRLGKMRSTVEHDLSVVVSRRQSAYLFACPETAPAKRIAESGIRLHVRGWIAGPQSRPDLSRFDLIPHPDQDPSEFAELLDIARNPCTGSFQEGQRVIELLTSAGLDRETAAERETLDRVRLGIVIADARIRAGTHLGPRPQVIASVLENL